MQIEHAPSKKERSSSDSVCRSSRRRCLLLANDKLYTLLSGELVRGCSGFVSVDGRDTMATLLEERCLTWRRTLRSAARGSRRSPYERCSIAACRAARRQTTPAGGTSTCTGRIGTSPPPLLLTMKQWCCQLVCC